MKYKCLVLATLIFNGCVAQNQKPDKIQVSFIHSKQTNLDSLKSEVTIYFVSGFNDSLIVKYDEKIILRDFFKTDFSTSYTGKSIVINYENKPKVSFFTVESTNDKFKVEIPFQKGYRVIELSRNNGNWGVIYSNIGPQFE